MTSVHRRVVHRADPRVDPGSRTVRGGSRILLTVWLFASLALSAQAQEPPPAPESGLFPPGSTGAITGRVLDDRTLRPLPDVTVSVSGTPFEVVTDQYGRFALRAIPAGEQRLELAHLAYGEHARLVLVQPDEHLTLEARISSRAIELAPLLVESMTDLDRRRRTTGNVMSEVLRPEIDEYHRTGRNLAEALRERLPGISVRSGRFGGACLEYRGGRAAGGPCRDLTVFLDGVRVAEPELLYTTLSPNDVERMELLSPSEAGARYGSVSGYGVLLIETRQGPRRVRPEAAGEDDRTGFDWTGEPHPYAWRRVFASTFAANALAVGISLALADQCFWRPETASLGLRTRCSGAATTGAVALGMALPTVASSLTARWGGETTVSRGRITPTSLSTALGLTSGYLLVIHGTGTSQVAGAVMLGLGVPVLTTLSDRIFRSLN